MQLRDKLRTKKIKAGVAAALLCTGLLCSSALAEGPVSNVWFDVVQVSSEARISVTVPMSYGFVVVGSVDPTDSTAISVDNGNLLLSNVRVAVITPSTIWVGPIGTPTEAVYELQMVGQGAAVPVRNYSTDVREEDLELLNPPREGLPVSVKPFVVEETVTNYWTAVGTQPAAVAGDFKKYRLEIGGQPLSETVSKMVGGTMTSGFQVAAEIPLEAPPDVPANGFTAAGAANVPSETYLSVDVEIGGQKGQYKQVEQSAKVSSVYWEVVPGQLPPVGTP